MEMLFSKWYYLIIHGNIISITSFLIDLFTGPSIME